MKLGKDCFDQILSVSVTVSEYDDQHSGSLRVIPCSSTLPSSAVIDKKKKKDSTLIYLIIYMNFSLIAN